MGDRRKWCCAWLPPLLADRVSWHCDLRSQEQPSPIEDSQMAKKKGLNTSPSSREPAPQPQKRPTISGTDHALTIPTTQGTSLDLSYWDLWFSIVAVHMHDGDLDRLANQIKEERGFHYDRRSVERKRCHIRDLKTPPGGSGDHPCGSSSCRCLISPRRRNERAIKKDERVHPPGARFVGANAEHAPRAAVHSRPAWLLGQVPGLARVLCKEDRCSLPLTRRSTRRMRHFGIARNPRRLCGGGKEAARSRQGGSGTGAPAEA